MPIATSQQWQKIRLMNIVFFMKNGSGYGRPSTRRHVYLYRQRYSATQAQTLNRISINKYAPMRIDKIRPMSFSHKMVPLRLLTCLPFSVSIFQICKVPVRNFFLRNIFQSNLCGNRNVRNDNEQSLEFRPFELTNSSFY